MIITHKAQTNQLIGKFLVGAPLPTREALKPAHLLPAIHTEILDVVQTFLTRQETLFRKWDDERSQTSSLESSDTLSSPRILSTDAWSFGTFWPHIQEICLTSDNLYEMIRQRHQEIREIRENVRPWVQSASDIEALLETGTLVLNDDGISGSYLLMAEGAPKFVIKPLDEDIGAINNPKGFASPFAYSMIRDAMPLYRSCFREVVAYEIGNLIGAPSIVPPTRLAILQNDQFFDLSGLVRPNEMARYSDQIGPVDKEKLCSMQQFVGQSKTLFEAAQDLQMSELLDEEIEALLDQQDFEDANMLLWVTGDTDGHMGNFLVTPKRVDDIGNQIFGLKKIDNGLAFPEANGGLVNSLIYLPNAQRPLSSAAVAKIQSLDPDAIADILELYGLEGSTQAMRARVETLKSIVLQDPSESIKSIHKKMAKLDNLPESSWSARSSFTTES